MACRKCLQGTRGGLLPSRASSQLIYSALRHSAPVANFPGFCTLASRLKNRYLPERRSANRAQRGFPRDRLGGTALNFGHLPVNELHSTDFKEDKLSRF